MEISYLIKQTISSLARHKLRTFLSILGIVFGVMAVVSMLSIGEGAKKEILDQIEQLGKNSLIIRYMDPGPEKRGENPRGLALSDRTALSKLIPDITVSSTLNAEGTIQERRGHIKAELLAVTPEYHQIRHLGLQEGRFLCDLDVKERALVCVIGADISRDLGLAGHVGQRININQTPFRIVGVLQPRELKQKKSSAISIRDHNKTLFFPMGVEASFVAKQPDKTEVDELLVKVPRTKDLVAYARVVENILEHSHRGVQDFQIVIPRELLQQEQEAQSVFNLVLGAIAGISLIVGGIGIMNIMLAIVSERTKEIGIRRALGANQYHILVQFVLETLTLTSCGTVIGVVLGVTMSFVIGVLAGWSVIISVWSLVIAVGMSTIVGLVSGLYPAYKAARMDPIAALRHD